MMLGRVQQQSYVGGLQNQAFTTRATPASGSPDHLTGVPLGAITDLSSIEDLDQSHGHRSESSGSDVVVVTTDKLSKFDRLHGVRYKLEHNQLSRSTSDTDKIQVFQVSQTLLFAFCPFLVYQEMNRIKKKSCPFSSINQSLESFSFENQFM